MIIQPPAQLPPTKQPEPRPPIPSSTQTKTATSISTHTLSPCPCPNHPLIQSPHPCVPSREHPPRSIVRCVVSGM